MSRQIDKGFDFEQILIQSRKQKVLDSLKKYPHKSILEIGCGQVPVFPFCRDFDFYTLVEPSPNVLKEIKKYSLGRPNIDFIPDKFEDIYESVDKSREFDFVILSSVLHETANPNKLLRAIHSVCGENTIVHINVPNMFSFHRLLAVEMGVIRDIFEKSTLDIKFQRTRNFDKETLYTLLKDFGFQVLFFKTYLLKLFSNEQMNELFTKGIVDKSVLAGLEEMIKYMPEFGCEMYAEAKKKRCRSF